MSATFAVIGAGPLGSCSARALADALDQSNTLGRVLLIDANNPLEQRFNAMSAAGPHAAGQLMLHVFDGNSPAKDLTRRSHELLRAMHAAGEIDLHRRPWICCAGNSGSELDVTTQDVLTQAHLAGRFEGCELVSGDAIPEVTGLRRDQVALALLDDTTMAVNPRIYCRQLAQRAVNHPRIETLLDTRVIRFSGSTLTIEDAHGRRDLSVDGIILCTGIHRNLCPDLLPPSRPEYLHVTEHVNAGHVPEVMHLITGETTIARYAGFGPDRKRITDLLDADIRDRGIHALFTDVPGLRRMLDSHFADLNEAESQNEKVWQLLRNLTGRYVEAQYLIGHPSSNRSADLSYVAAYTKLLDSDGPWLDRIDAEIPAVYAQPSNGLGLNQCAALGEDAARLLLS